MQSTCESGGRAAYDGNKKKKGSKAHMAVDTLGNLPEALVTPANEQERAQVWGLATRIKELTGRIVRLAFVDQGYTGNEPTKAAEKRGMKLEIVRLEEAKKEFVLLPRRWVVERSFGWINRFRRMTRDFERLQETIVVMYFVVFAILMLHKAAPLLNSSLHPPRNRAKTR